MKTASSMSPAPKSIILSTPGTPEKFPGLGLARLLSRRSRSRARSSPMLVSRSRSLGRAPSVEAQVDQGEPSSPKVTCIGQVRIRKSNHAKKKKNSAAKSKTKTKTKTKPPPIECRCFHLFHRKPRCVRLWPSWKSCVKFRGREGYNKSYKQSTTDLGVKEEEEIETRSNQHQGDNLFRVEEEEGEDETEIFVTPPPPPPPKNALLLMRCRSAPHNRASSLSTCATLFPTEESKVVEEEEMEESKSSKGDGGEEEDEDEDENEEEEEEDEIRCSSSRALVLTRCKSEPARRAAEETEMVVAEEASSYCFWSSSNSSKRRHRWLDLAHVERTPPPLRGH